MEVQLKELLDSIKNEGIRAADIRSGEITEKAEKDAALLVENAEKKAAAIVADAKVEAAKLEASGKAALEQAGRNLLLQLKGTITRVFDEIVKSETAKAMSADVIQKGILAILSSWKGDLDDIAVLVDEETAAVLGNAFEASLVGELKKGLEIKPFKGIDKGFRITEKDGSGYYDFSSSGLSEMICKLLNPRLEEIVKKALEA